MHIHRSMFGNSNALSETPATQADGAAAQHPALQSGASVSAATTAAAAATDDISSQERTIAGDVRHLVHALFEASGASAPPGSATSGLAVLIGQIQSGSAPSNIQRAFDRLVADVGQNDGVTTPAAESAASVSTPTPASALNDQGLLAQFLTNVQSNLGLGYGGSAAPAQGAAHGLIVDTLA